MIELAATLSLAAAALAFGWVVRGEYERRPRRPRRHRSWNDVKRIEFARRAKAQVRQ